MTVTDQPVDNGVNVQALLDAREQLSGAPEAAQFTWKASCEWVNGTHSRSSVEGFFGLGADQSHKSEYTVESDHPEIFVVSNIVEDGRHIGAHGGSKRYHSDLSYLPEPSMGSLFYCLECPDEGGETAFASMFAAFDALPEEPYKSLEAQVLYPRRLGRPDEIAHLAQYIAENDYTNGECIRMDGGIRMQPR